MKLFSRGGKKLVAIFDIGSTNVKGALAEIRLDAAPQILAYQRKNIALQEKMNHKRFFSSLVSTFEQVAESLEGTKKKESVDEVVCFFSSPWYDAKYDTVSFEKDSPFIVTEELIEEEVNKAVEVFEKEEKEKYGEGELGAPLLIEKMSMRVALNGYEVSDFEKRKAKEVEVSFFASVVPEKVLTELKAKIARRFNHRKTFFRTFPFASYVAIRDIFLPHSSSFFFVDIAGEISDLFWIEDNIIKKSATFPLGKNFLLRKIAEVLHVDMKEAYSLYSMYREGKTEKNISLTIEKSLEWCKKEWLDRLEKTSSSFSRKGFSPRDIFFVSDMEVSEWFRGILADASFGNRSRMHYERKKPTVHFLGGTHAKKICEFPSGVEKDPFLGIEAAFWSRFANEGSMR